MKTVCLALGLALVHGAATAQAIQRCEDSAGRPTYTNGNCPSGTRAARPVDTAPPVSDADRKAAQAQARQEAERVKALDKEATTEQQHRRAASDKTQRAEADRAARCERSRRELARAQATRADLGTRAVKVEAMQKADRAIAQAEEKVGRDCPPR